MNNLKSRFVLIFFGAILMLLVNFAVGSYAITKVPSQRVDDVLSKMSLSQKIGQFLMVSLYDVPKSDQLHYFDTGFVGSAILFKDAKKIEQILTIRNIFNEAAPKTMHQLPIFMAIDHEGGGLGRLGTVFPRMRALGVLDKEKTTKCVGKTIGKEVNRLGINIVFAPVCDVNTVFENPIIGTRSFSHDPEIVSRHCLAFAKGMFSEDIIPVAKHFPGHGASREDSHLVLPRVDLSTQNLVEKHLFPFQTAINGGIPMIMTSHVLYTNLDAQHPATLSQKMLQQTLRNEMGFQGVIISDHLEMNAVRQGKPIAEVAFQAWRAGVDLLMMPRDFREIEKVHRLFVDAVFSGEITETLIDQRVKRLIKLKLLVNNNDMNQTNINDAKKTLRKKSHLKLADKILKQSIQVTPSTYKDQLIQPNQRLLLLGSDGQFLTGIQQKFSEHQVTVIRLREPINSTRRWKMRSQLMKLSGQVKQQTIDWIENDYPISKKVIREVKQLSTDVDLIILGVETPAEAVTFDALAKELNVPMIAFFYGTRFSAPLLADKTNHFQTEFVAYPSPMLKSKAIQYLIDRAFD